jgi:hypothetical protein
MTFQVTWFNAARKQSFQSVFRIFFNIALFGLFLMPELRNKGLGIEVTFFVEVS